MMRTHGWKTCGTNDTGDRMNGVVMVQDRPDYFLRTYVLVDDMEQGGKRRKLGWNEMGGYAGLDSDNRRNKNVQIPPL